MIKGTTPEPAARGKQPAVHSEELGGDADFSTEQSIAQISRLQSGEMTVPTEKTGLLTATAFSEDDTQTDPELLQVETTWHRYARWATLDVLVERLVQSFFISRASLVPQEQSDSEEKDSTACPSMRVLPTGRAILIQDSTNLIAAKAAGGLVEGIESMLFVTMHIALWSMLGYRVLLPLINGNAVDTKELWDILDSNEKVGFNSLVRTLADAPPWLLKSLPGLVGATGVLYAVREAYAARRQTPEHIDAGIQRLESFKLNCFADYVGFLFLLRKIPPFLLIPSLHFEKPFMQIEHWMLWDARVNSSQRRKLWRILEKFATEGSRLAQREALHVIAHLAQGIAVNDIKRLQAAGVPKEQIAELETIKALSVYTLRHLSQVYTPSQANSFFSRYLQPLPRYIYANYLLWWLGFSNHLLGQRLSPLTALGFWLFKLVKLGFEVRLIKVLIESIINAIECPDEKGFEFGKAFPVWANQLDIPCFEKVIGLFRKLPGQEHEDIQPLLKIIPEFNLHGLAEVNLQNKYLTPLEASQIIGKLAEQEGVSQSLQRVYLGENNFGAEPPEPEGISTLMGQLAHLQSMQALYLNFTSIGTVALAQGLHGLPQLKILDLSYNSIGLDGTEGIEALGLGLNDLRLLEELYLGENEIGEHGTEGAIALGRGLSGLPQLKILDLSCNNIGLNGTEGTVALAKGFSGLEQLKILDLSCNNIGLNGTEGTVALAKGLSGLEQLKILDLGNNEIGKHGTEGTIALGRGLSGLEQLKILNLGHNFIGLDGPEGTVALGWGLRGLTQLKELYLSWNDIGRNSPEGTVVLGRGLSGLTQLKILDLSDNNIGRNGTEGTVALGQGLGGLRQLQRLDLSSNRIGECDMNIWKTLGKVVFNLSKKTVIDLSGNYLDIHGAQLFLAQINASRLATGSLHVMPGFSNATLFTFFINQLPAEIKELDLGNLTDELQQILGKQLPRFTQLRTLDISSTEASPNDTEGAVALGHGLSGLTQLQELILIRYYYGQTSSDGIVALGQGLRGLTQLRILDLSNNQIGQHNLEGVGALGYGLSGLMQLQKLYLVGNAIGQNGTENTVALAKGLSGLTQLEQLALSESFIGQNGTEGTVALAKGLSGLTQLKMLALEANDIGRHGTEGTEALGQALSGLKQLRILYLGSNQIGLHGPAGIAAIAKALKSLPELQIDISGNPDATNTEGPLFKLIAEVRSRSLLQRCHDHLCHANTPINWAESPTTSSANRLTPPLPYRYFTTLLALPVSAYQALSQPLYYPRASLSAREELTVSDATGLMLFSPSSSRRSTATSGFFTEQESLYVEPHYSDLWLTAHCSAMQNVGFATYIATARAFLQTQDFSQPEISAATFLLALGWLSIRGFSLLPTVASNTVIATGTALGLRQKHSALLNVILMMALSVYSHAPETAWDAAHLMTALISTVLMNQLVQSVVEPVAERGFRTLGFFSKAAEEMKDEVRKIPKGFSYSPS